MHARESLLIRARYRCAARSNNRCQSFLFRFRNKINVVNRSARIHARVLTTQSLSVECSKCSGQPARNLRSPTKGQPSRNFHHKKLRNSWFTMPSWATKEQKRFWPWFVQPIKRRSKLGGVSMVKLGEPLPVNGVRDPENMSSLVSPQVRFPRMFARNI
jgi:hypothetical protein